MKAVLFGGPSNRHIIDLPDGETRCELPLEIGSRTLMFQYEKENIVRSDIPANHFSFHCVGCYTKGEENATNDSTSKATDAAKAG
jgi:hypothetical protein